MSNGKFSGSGKESRLSYIQQALRHDGVSLLTLSSIVSPSRPPQRAVRRYLIHMGLEGVAEVYVAVLVDVPVLPGLQRV